MLAARNAIGPTCETIVNAILEIAAYSSDAVMYGR
jgi:hypothetical protein